MEEQIKKINEITAQYKRRLSEIDDRWTDKAKKEYRSKINTEYAGHFTALSKDIRSYINNIESGLSKLMNPEIELVTRALNQADKVTAGHTAIISAIKHLDPELLKVIADTTTVPAIQLALLAHSNLKTSILANVPLQTLAIKKYANEACQGIKALMEAEEIQGQLSLADKMTYGRKLAELESIAVS